MLGSVGGDVYKIWVVGRAGGGVGVVAGATIVDRLVGLSALCTLASVAALLEIPSSRVPVGQLVFVLAFGLAVLGTSSLLLHPRTVKRRRRVENLRSAAGARAWRGCSGT
jgi:hypothetical protein